MHLTHFSRLTFDLGRTFVVVVARCLHFVCQQLRCGMPQNVASRHTDSHSEHALNSHHHKYIYIYIYICICFDIVCIYIVYTRLFLAAWSWAQMFFYILFSDIFSWHVTSLCKTHDSCSGNSQREFSSIFLLLFRALFAIFTEFVFIPHEM